jgi:hypothetical protein
VIRALAGLVGSLLLLWAVLVGPAALLFGPVVLLHGGVAMAVCLVPAVITLLCGAIVQRGSPERRLLSVLVGMGVRMVLVLGVGLGLALATETFHHFGFILWLLVFYLASLALETALLLGSLRPQEGIKA